MVSELLDRKEKTMKKLFGAIIFIIVALSILFIPKFSTSYANTSGFHIDLNINNNNFNHSPIKLTLQKDKRFMIKFPFTIQSVMFSQKVYFTKRTVDHNLLQLTPFKAVKSLMVVSTKGQNYTFELEIKDNITPNQLKP